MLRFLIQIWPRIRESGALKIVYNVCLSVVELVGNLIENLKPKRQTNAGSVKLGYFSSRGRRFVLELGNAESMMRTLNRFLAVEKGGRHPDETLL